MTDDAELQARIAAIAGQINQARQQAPGYSHARGPPNPHIPRAYPQWSPYSLGGRVAYPAAHKNRTLVLNGSNASTGNNGDTTITPETLVKTTGTNKQLMTKDTYEREQKQKLQYKQQQRMVKRQKRNFQEQSRILQHFDTVSNETSREMMISGARFRLTADGSKLIRVPDAGLGAKETPKKTTIAGVDFYRTKTGNLVRASALKPTARPAQTKQAHCEHFTKHGTLTHFHLSTGFALKMFRPHRRSRHAGTCPYGPNCRFAHDPNKVAICKDFLKSGSCPRGDSCDMSHEMTYHRVPACTYFLRGNCTNDACRYPHVKVSPAASVCRAFATLGFCAKGSDCDKRHVFECPDYSNNGFCANRASGKCSLPHTDRASVLRKAAERQAKNGSEGESDLSSDEENDDDEDMEDVSDGEEILMTGGDSHGLSQQQDFVAF